MKTNAQTRLALLSWPEVQDYLQSRRTIILPIGSHEQHGPTGLIGTDAICAEEIAWEAGRRSATIVGPTIGIGMAHYHLGFAGSISLRPSTLLALVLDVVGSLRLHGFAHFFFVNAHGGNCSTVRTAFDELHAAASFGDDGGREPPRFTLINWWEGPRVRRVQHDLYGDNEGMHAVASEISLTYWIYPEAMKRAVLDPPVATTGPVLDANDYRRRFPDGRIGSDPSPACPDHGRLFLDAAAGDLIETMDRCERGFEAERLDEEAERLDERIATGG